MKLKAGVHMNVSRDRLSVIGKLIGIYREERRGNTQNSFTLKKFCEGICSINTLKNIEAGGLSRSEDVYIELLGKLDLKFGEFLVVDEALVNLFAELYKAIEFYERETVILLIEKGKRLLYQVKDYIYYSETYYILDRLYEYYTYDSQINELELRKYLMFLDKEVFCFDDILKLLIYVKSSTYCVLDMEQYIKIVNKIKLDNVKLHCLKINLIHYYLSKGDFISMNKIIDELEEIFAYEDNRIRLLDILNCRVSLNSYNNKVILDVVIDHIEELIKTYNFPDIKLSEAYANIGSAFHNDKNYNLALEYYKKSFSFYRDNYLPTILYMADCQNRLGLDIDIPILDDKDISSYPVELIKMYKYFTLGNDIPAFVKQNYIMKQILPYLENEVNIEIFKYELGRIVDITGHYKNFLIFEREIQKKSYS